MSEDPLQYLTPQMAQRLAEVAYIPEEHAGLQQQLEQAIALRSQPRQQRLSPEAATYDGVGDLVRNIGSFAQEHDLRGQQKAMRSQQKNGYGEYLKALAEALRGTPQQQQMPQPAHAPAAPSFTPMDYSQA